MLNSLRPILGYVNGLLICLYKVFFGACLHTVWHTSKWVMLCFWPHEQVVILSASNHHLFILILQRPTPVLSVQWGLYFSNWKCNILDIRYVCIFIGNIFIYFILFITKLSYFKFIGQKLFVYNINSCGKLPSTTIFMDFCDNCT